MENYIFVILAISVDENQRSGTPTKRPGRYRKSTTVKMDNDFGHWDSTNVLLNFIFVEDQHRNFEKVHKKVKNLMY